MFVLVLSLPAKGYRCPRPHVFCASVPTHRPTSTHTTSPRHRSIHRPMIRTSRFAVPHEEPLPVPVELSETVEHVQRAPQPPCGHHGDHPRRRRQPALLAKTDPQREHGEAGVQVHQGNDAPRVRNDPLHLRGIAADGVGDGQRPGYDSCHERGADSCYGHGEGDEAAAVAARLPRRRSARGVGHWVRGEGPPRIFFVGHGASLPHLVVAAAGARLKGVTVS
mmetsp:Transcript_19663/g.31856  ORF Transcript_19663/g.31856 Transcript_19663/m.31856 type:complete len:222 (+) Transcript_19663:683-1348(+)